MAWCTKEDLDTRLAAVEGLALDDAEALACIVRAETEIKSELSGVYSMAVMTAWATAVPPRIAQLAADLAALFVLKDKMPNFTGRTGDRDSTYGFMKRLRESEADLYTADDVLIARSGYQIKFNTTSKTPIFGMGNEGDSTTGEGTLDDY